MPVHCGTGQKNLCVEKDALIKTPFRNSVIPENIAFSYSVNLPPKNLSSTFIADNGLCR
jgi:hypothetical protein